MKFNLLCMSCGEKLDVTETSMPYTVDGETVIDVSVDPCGCMEPEKDLYPELGNAEPIRLPYLTLARILVKKVVNVTYRKKNGDLRELTGFLGTNDLRHVDSKLHYFHELDDDGVDSEVGGLAKTNCKCLMIDRIIHVTHFDADSGIQTIYEVEEYF